MDTLNDRPISTRERTASRRLANALGELRLIHRTMPLQLARTYLHVTLEEGLTVTALAARCGVDVSVMSRHLQDLGNVNRHRKRGLELVSLTQMIHGDRREHRVILTERGAALARRMIAHLKPKANAPQKTEDPLA